MRRRALVLHIRQNIEILVKMTKLLTSTNNIDHNWMTELSTSAMCYTQDDGPVCFIAAQGISRWASYQIRKIAGCACVGKAGNVFPRRRFQRKLLVSDPGMHHGTCVTNVPWCMSGSLTYGDGKNVPGIPGACTPAILRFWQEAHGKKRNKCNGFPRWHCSARARKRFIVTYKWGI